MAGGGSQGKGASGGAMRRGPGFRSVGASAREPLKKAAARHGFAETDVLTRWPEIVGAALAPLCRPLKVKYRDRMLGAVLTVEVDGARAPELEMTKPRILERINAFYGYRAIGAIRITQAGGRHAPVGGFAEAQAGFSGPPADNEIDDAVLGRAGTLTEGVRNPELRDALTRLGAYVMNERRGRSDD